jgi:hypothetical protein
MRSITSPIQRPTQLPSRSASKPDTTRVPPASGASSKQALARACSSKSSAVSTRWSGTLAVICCEPLPTVAGSPTHDRFAPTPVAGPGQV